MEPGIMTAKRLFSFYVKSVHKVDTDIRASWRVNDAGLRSLHRECVRALYVQEYDERQEKIFTEMLQEVELFYFSMLTGDNLLLKKKKDESV